ncbi:hypothetical protein [Streptomyces sp. NPDC049555]|uniref:hypothetical protein n=1 Tax=Streptomyces sp. NPDC049555 TaxID=3154930 RepID=UPI00342745B8
MPHPTARTTARTAARTAAAGALTAVVLGLAPLAHAAPAPAAPLAPPADSVTAAHRAAEAPATLETLARFFAGDGARGAGRGTAARQDAQPRIDGATVPVYTLSPDFVAGKEGAPLARLEFLASAAVSADGRKASVWTVPADLTAKDMNWKSGSWKVVNIATGDDETRYAAEGARRLAGGTVFREPQIDAWYVQRGDRVLPLDPDAEHAIGARGTTVHAYRARVHRAYGDQLPGSAYDRRGLAGGGQAAAPGAAGPATAAAQQDQGSPAPAVLAGGAGAAAALGLAALAARGRLRRR